MTWFGRLILTWNVLTRIASVSGAVERQIARPNRIAKLPE
jgi:hypothetical protein